MKRKFKSFLSLSILFGGMLLALQGCKEETLVFPEQVKQDVVITEKRPTARPTNLTVVTDYNQKIEIYWPQLSDRVTKALVSYTDDSGEKKIDVTVFDKPTILSFDKEATYDVNIVYYTVDNVASKNSVIKVTTLPFEANRKASGVRTETIEGGVKFIFPATTSKLFEYRVDYKVNGVDQSKIVTSDSLNAQLDVKGLNDELLNYDFGVIVTDKILSKVSPKNVIQSKPGPLPYVEVLNSLVFSQSYNSGKITYSKSSDAVVNLVIKYLLNGVATEKKVTVSKAGAYSDDFLIGSGVTNVLVEVSGEENLKKAKSGTVQVMLTSFTTAAQKGGWTPYTDIPYDANGSYNFGTSLDGNSTGDWSFSYASGSKATKTLVIHFTKTRISSPLSYNASAQLSPSGPFIPIIAKGMKFYFMNWATVPNEVAVYGVKEDRTEFLLKRVTIPRNLLTFNVDFPENNEKLIGLKFLLIHPTSVNTGIAEIDISGYGI